MKKVILTLLSIMTGIVGGAVVCKQICNKTISEKEMKVDKFKSYYNVLIRWFQLKHSGKNFKKYFEKKEWKTIAIYGMGELGNCLYEELKEEGVAIQYAIDQNAGNTFSEIEVYDKEDELPEVEVIIVTAIFAFDEIEEQLKDKTKADIISLEDLIYDI